MDTTIIPLAERAGLRVGETVNVLLFGEGGCEHFKTLTGVDIRREYGADWLILRWAPGGPTPWGTESCGFAGWKVDDALRERLRDMTPNVEFSGGAPLHGAASAGTQG